MTVAGVAVLGKDNNPLYIRAYGPHDQLRFHFIVHTGLDFLEEKVTAQRQAAGTSAAAAATSKHDCYLGLLYPIEELRVYGYLTNSRIKLIAVLDDEEVKDTEMKALFRRLHNLYTDTVSNPFHTPDTELYGCASFDRQVQRIVEAGYPWNFEPPHNPALAARVLVSHLPLPCIFTTHFRCH